jgi:hypothetical protein
VKAGLLDAVTAARTTSATATTTSLRTNFPLATQGDTAL